MGFISNVDISNAFSIRYTMRPDLKTMLDWFVSVCYDCPEEYQGFIYTCVRIWSDANLPYYMRPLIQDPRDKRPYDPSRNLTMELKEARSKESELKAKIQDLRSEEMETALSSNKRSELRKEREKLQKELSNILYPRVIKGNMAMVKANVTRPKDLEKQLRKLRLYMVDTYITMNRFKSTKSRAAGDLFALSNLVIDIDLHDPRYPEKEIIRLVNLLVYLLETELFGEGIDPNVVVFTGRGIQLWFAIDPIHSKCPKMYKEVVEHIVDMVEDFIKNHPCISMFQVDRAASTNRAGLVRLPGSYNTKTKTWGDLYIRHADRINIPDEFYKLYPALKPDPDAEKNEAEETAKQEGSGKGKGKSKGKPKSKKKNKKHFPKTLSELAVTREDKLYKLLRLRIAKNGNIPRDHFLLIIFSVYMSTTGEKDIAYRQMLMFNSKFPNPMPEKEARAYMSSAEKKAYKFKNETVINLLGITQKEQKSINLYPVKKREKTGCDNRKKKLELDEQIIEACGKGLNKKQIAKEVGCSPQTVKRVLDRLRLKTAKEKLHNSVYNSFLRRGKRTVKKYKRKMSISNIYYIRGKAILRLNAIALEKEMEAKKQERMQQIEQEPEAEAVKEEIMETKEPVVNRPKVCNETFLAQFAPDLPYDPVYPEPGPGFDYGLYVSLFAPDGAVITEGDDGFFTRMADGEKTAV